jgi:hypothetical protein
MGLCRRKGLKRVHVALGILERAKGVPGRDERGNGECPSGGDSARSDQTVRETWNKNVKGRSHPQAQVTWIRLLTTRALVIPLVWTTDAPTRILRAGATLAGEEVLRHFHCPSSALGTIHISPRMTTHEWQPAISCNGMKLIAPIDWGDFQISLIYAERGSAARIAYVGTQYDTGSKGLPMMNTDRYVQWKADPPN